MQHHSWVRADWTKRKGPRRAWDGLGVGADWTIRKCIIQSGVRCSIPSPLKKGASACLPVLCVITVNDLLRRLLNSLSVLAWAGP